MKWVLFIVCCFYLAGCTSDQSYDRGYVISQSEQEEISPAVEN